MSSETVVAVATDNGIVMSRKWP